jgi:transposase
MGKETFDIKETLESAKKLLQEEKNISPALKAIIKILITIVTLFASKMSLNSRNSSKPPSSDPNRKKTNKPKGTNRKPGGQPGRVGVNLQPVENPDHIVNLEIDQRTLPRGTYHEAGFEMRQIVEMEISTVITEYRAQILEDTQGNRYVATFPEGLTRPIQYGTSIKSHAVYMSQFQLIPYERVSDYFANEIHIPLSVGSLYNFNKEAYEQLETFESLAKEKLTQSALLHVDETGININGKRKWLHTTSSEYWTYFFPHDKRGTEAMDEIGILPNFHGILMHDHWKPYFQYDCDHVLCNAHHTRELQWVIDNHPSYTWAQKTQDLLFNINERVNANATHILDEHAASVAREQYRALLIMGRKQMPHPLKLEEKRKGRTKKTKELNLLERLENFEKETLRFMVDSLVPFTNNIGENDLRMTKVQQKISGCFRSLEGAKIFCRVRSYLLTAQKHGISPTEALKVLFSGKLPEVFFTRPAQ